jgi:uridine kinase
MLAASRTTSSNFSFFSNYSNNKRIPFQSVQPCFGRLTEQKTQASQQYVSNIENLNQKFPELVTQLDKDKLEKSTARYLEEKRNNPNRSYMIGIVGGSASGKSTIADRLVKALQAVFPNIAHINMDHYYQDRSLLRKELGPNQLFETVSFDCPAAFQMRLFSDDLAALQRGDSIRSPSYRQSVSTLRQTEIKAAPVTVAEGLMLSARKNLRKKFDLILSVDLDAKTRRKRWENRLTVHNRLPGVNREKFWKHVQEGYTKFIEPFKQKAMMVLSNAKPAPVNLDEVKPQENESDPRMKSFIKELAQAIQRLIG